MKKENKGKIRIVFWIVFIALTVIISATCAALRVPSNIFRVVLIVYAVVLVIAWFTINMTYVSKLAKRVDSILPILYEEGDPDRYLKELEYLLGDTKSPAFKSIYCINRCAAYCDKENYERAKEVLLEIKPEKVPGLNRLVYYLNMAIVSMYLGEDEKALEIWKANEREFMKLKGSVNLGAAVVSVYVFNLIKEEQFDEAAKELESAKLKWTRPREWKGFDFLERKMQNDAGDE